MLLLVLLLGGTGLSRLIPFVVRGSLRRERDRLTAEYQSLASPARYREALTEVEDEPRD